MSFKYEISTGNLYDTSNAEDELVAHGWAGHDTDAVKGYNNPDAISVKGIGPLPPGFYLIGDPVDHPHVGKLAFPLFPYATNKMYGRSGFFIHGPNLKDIKHSSDGCMCFLRYDREKISVDIKNSDVHSPKRVLKVVL